MFVHSISKEDLQQLPVGQFHGQIHLIESPSQVAKACNELMKATIIGFDTETKPSFTKGNVNRVSLLQLSTATDAYLFRLNMVGLMPDIIRVLSSSQHLKVGVAIRDDIRLLAQLHPFKANGFIELQDYVRQYNIENSGLSKLAGIILDFRISKSQQLTNWENTVLTPAQQLYAATDAWAAYEIYKKLIAFPVENVEPSTGT